MLHLNLENLYEEDPSSNQKAQGITIKNTDRIKPTEPLTLRNQDIPKLVDDDSFCVNRLSSGSFDNQCLVADENYPVI